jgi:hypothetical protein
MNNGLLNKKPGRVGVDRASETFCLAAERSENTQAPRDLQAADDLTAAAAPSAPGVPVAFPEPPLRRVGGWNVLKLDRLAKRALCKCPGSSKRHRGGDQS